MISSTYLVASVGLAGQAFAACSRSLLQNTAATYLQAQSAGQYSLLPLAKNVSYTENDVSMDITKGVLAQPLKIDSNHSLLDTTQCAIFAELTAATDKHPYVIHTQMHVTDDKISKVQSVVADEGDWAFNATAHLYWNQHEDWSAIPEAQRDTRAVIQAAGDAYLTSWTLNSTVKVPYGAPCARLEGGTYTSTLNSPNNTCTMGDFPVSFVVTNRRYVIDETVGGLSIFNNFPFLDVKRPDSTPSSNFFRIVGGKIRYIHENSICEEFNCGR